MLRNRLEGSLARAENRIVQLSPLNGGKESIVTPGVSRKVLESLTKENTKLKDALEHLTQRKDGPDLVVENKDLHEIIVTLRDERDEKVKQVEQLLQSLTAIERKPGSPIDLRGHFTGEETESQRRVVPNPDGTIRSWNEGTPRGSRRKGRQGGRHEEAARKRHEDRKGTRRPLTACGTAMGRRKKS